MAMSSNWYDYAFDHLEELGESGTREGKALVALFSLDGEFNNGGLIQYLMNESGDTWPQLKDAFELGHCVRGTDWMKRVEEAFGGWVPHDRDSRIEMISGMPAYQRGEDPFQELDTVLTESLMHEVQEIGEKLVRSIQS
jgi:hypothetical protein